MNFKKALYTFLFIFIYVTANCQNGNKILVYANKNDFLLPYINSVLYELNNTITGKKIFSKVTNLNLLFVNTDADKLLRADILYNFPEKDFHSDTSIRVKDSIFNVFINNDKFLLVNENILQDKIEFQFTLYNILSNVDQIKNTSGNTFPLKDIIKPIASNDFFIDITSSDYLTVLKNGVKKLFPESNFQIQFRTTITGNVNEISKDSFLTAVEDTFKIAISEVYNQDVPIEKIVFGVSPLETYEMTKKLFYISSNDPYNFCIIFHDTGLYKLIVNASNGIVRNQTDTLKVKVLQLPKIISLVDHVTLPYTKRLTPFKLAFKIPFVIKNNNDSLNFNLVQSNPEQDETETLIDSIKYATSQSVSARYPTTYPINYIPPNSIPLQLKKEKISPNYYVFAVKASTRMKDSLLLLYGTTQGIHTNIEKIKLRIIGQDRVIFGSGIGIHQLLVKQDNCNCSDSSRRFNYYELTFIHMHVSLYSFQNIAFSIEANSGIPIYSSSETQISFPIRKVKGPSFDMGITASAQFLSSNFFYDIGVGFFTRKLGLMHNIQSPDYGTYGASLIGGKFFIDVASLKNKKWGFFIRGGLFGDNYHDVKYNDAGLNIGMLYNSLF